LAEQAGLLVSRKDGDYYDRFRGRLMFPIEDINGNVIAFGGRVIGEGEPKYLNSPESSIYVKGRNLYGLARAKSAIRRDETLIIVEGYFDLLALWNNGIPNVAATLGTALTREHVESIKRYTGAVAITFDTDAGGKAALERSMSLFLERGLRAKAVVLPDGKDPDEFVSKHGREAFLSEVDRARALVDYYIDEVIGQGKNIDERRGALKGAIPFIAGITDPAERDQFIKRVSERLGVDEELVRREVSRQQQPPVRKEGASSPLRPAAAEIDLVELSLIQIMMENPSRIHEVVQGNVLDYFMSDAMKGLAETIAASHREGRPSHLAGVIDRIENGAVREKLLELTMSAASPDSGVRERLFEDTVRRIKERWYKERQRDLRVRLLRAQEAEDQELFNRLLNEKERLRHEQKELKR
jgi:DNA primase